MAVGKTHDGKNIIIDDFNKVGNYKISNRVVVDSDGVLFSKILQVDYSVVHKEHINMSHEQAISAARAILKHFGAGIDPVGKEEW